MAPVLVFPMPLSFALLFRSGRLLALSLGLLLLAGCATSTTPANPADPFESFNRSMYSFNKGLDSVTLRPAAKAYDAVIPKVLDERIENAMSNVGDVVIIGNSLLQAKFKGAAISTGRFLINSTFGVLGLFDPATSMGLVKRYEDFGQTLAEWGVPDGPYLMLPFFGPKTTRDAFGIPVDSALEISTDIAHVPTRNTALGFRLMDERQGLFPIEKTLEESLDEYAFVRDAYLQRRKYLIHDGNPPVSADADDCDPGLEECY